MLSDVEILEALGKREIVIDPFDEECLEPASYDMRLGRVLSPHLGVVHLSGTIPRKFVLENGQWALLETHETISLSRNYVATFGLRSSITRRGILWFSGPQADPGFHGRLYISVFNASGEPFQFRTLQPFLTIQFFKLGKTASKAYSGKYQGLTSFPSEEVIYFKTMEGKTLAEAVSTVKTLEQAVGDLSKSFSTLTREADKLPPPRLERIDEKLGALHQEMRWIRNILLGLLLLIAAAMVIVVTSNSGLVSP